MKFKDPLPLSELTKKNPCDNRAESLINFFQYETPPAIQIAAAKYFAELKESGERVDLGLAFKKVYNDPTLEKDDKRFKGFKHYYLKLNRGTESPNYTPLELENIVKWGSHKSARDIALTLFPELNTKPPSFLAGAASHITNFLDVFGIRYTGPKEFNKDEITDSDYNPPDNDDAVLKKINIHLPGVEWRAYGLDAHQKRCVKVLKAQLSSLRYKTAINSIQNVKHRQLFEEQFVKEVFDKPELLPSDFDSYLTLSELTVELYAATKRLHSLVKDFEDTLESDEKSSGGAGMRAKLTESIATVSKERDLIRNSIQKLAKDLNGSRDKRRDEERAKNQSVSKIIQDFTDYRNRARAIASAEARNKELKEMMDEIEGYDGINKGELNGVSKDEIFHYRFIPQ